MVRTTSLLIGALVLGARVAAAEPPALQLFGMCYQPHVALIPIAGRFIGRFMMHPDDAAYAAKLLMTDNPNLKTVIPQHVRIKGAAPWMGTAAQFEAEIKKLGLPLKVVSPVPGKEITLGK